MVLFDVQQRIVMGELSTPFVKYVMWSKDMSQVNARLPLLSSYGMLNM